ncbi:MAG TPA: rhodanese-like domain-containing protein [Pyrinomonadaceae bacterium]|nr:rhodanese-like domain-containing protein [Pyrinomonadaceae bacterium]
MKKLILLFALLFAAACNSVHSNANNQANSDANSNANTRLTKRSLEAGSPPPDAHAHADDVKRITTAELEALMKEGKAVVVDVRNKAMFDAGHIRGAKLIPVGEVANRANELPKDKTIVTYCS